MRRLRPARCAFSRRRSSQRGSRGLSIGVRLRGPIIAHLAALIALIGAASMTPSHALQAQSRELEQYGAGSPEAKLMLYYSSSVAFSPLGVMNTLSGTSRRFEGALELSFLPPLSEEQRTTGTDKPEATNLAPVFARPRVNVRLPGAGLPATGASFLGGRPRRPSGELRRCGRAWSW